MGATHGAKECHADSGHKVVWMAGPKGVAGFDTVDGTQHAVVEKAVEIERFVVHAFDDPRAPYPSVLAGNFAEMEDCVALVIAIGADPTVGGVVVGEGDRGGRALQGFRALPRGVASKISATNIHKVILSAP